jgi:hypothetical protein
MASRVDYLLLSSFDIRVEHQRVLAEPAIFQILFAARNYVRSGTRLDNDYEGLPTATRRKELWWLL